MLLRRLLSILLLAVFALPLATPLLALGQDADAGLPACCRRAGKHHCAMNMAQLQKSTQSTEPQFRAPMAPCKFYGTVANVLQHELARPAAARAIFAGLQSHPAVHAQEESRRRLALDRARQKRGPPPASLSERPGLRLT